MAARVLVVAALLVLSACDKPQPAPAPTAARADSFDEERAWKDLQALCALGSRCHGSEAHTKARTWLHEQLAACGAEVRDMPFEFRGSEDAQPEPFVNVGGRFAGKGTKWILLGSHYDSRSWADVDKDASKHNTPIEGANDSGSGVAVLLEVARALQKHPPDVGVEIVFFDGEDYGRPGKQQDYFVGSRDLAASWSRWYPGPKPACAVILDMVGDSDLSFLREGTCQQECPWLNDLLWKAGGELKYPAFGVEGEKAVTDDHTALLQIGIPATLVIDFDYPHWHTSHDTIDKCCAKSLGVIGRVLLRALVDRPFEVP